MPPKKQTKPNGFMVFMQEMKPRLQSDGHRFPRGLVDVQQVCGPLWDNMTAEQKAVYNQKAKGVKAAVKEEKYDTRGVPLSLKEKEENEKAEAKTLMYRHIEEMIGSLANKGELQNEYFHFAHFNYAVVTDEQEFPPCEIAIVKFSLLHGIKQTYHSFINPGKLRLGYSFAAKEHAEATHKIPSTDPNFFAKECCNYMDITDKLKAICSQSDGGIAPVFILESDIPKAKYIFDWLIDRASEACVSGAIYDRTNPFKAYSIDKLFYELRRHADLKDHRLSFTSPLMAAERLGSGDFDHCPNMACEWHEEIDRTVFCSLTRVRGYAYVISDYCCEYYDLALLAGKHCPASMADEGKYEIKPKIQRLQEVEEATVKPDVTNTPPRMPQSHGNLVGSRLAANFRSGSVGVGRGMLGAGMSAFASAVSSAGASSVSTPPETPPPAMGRGRGRLLLADN